MPKKKKSKRPALAFTEDQLCDKADSGSWVRGVDYYEGGYVGSIMRDGDTIIARVSGTRDYLVTLTVRDAGISGDCTCPMGERGVFCKHCVAAGLAYLDEAQTDAAERHEGESKVTLDDVREYLAGQDIETLVDIIVEQMKRDESLARSLMTKTALKTSDGVDLAMYKRAIADAMAIDDFIDSHASYGYANDIDAIVDSIAELLDSGQAEAVIELTEYALEQWEAAGERIDDSDGQTATIKDALHDLHLRACEAAKPEPKALARRLFERRMGSGGEMFRDAAEKYVQVLGREGLAAYRRLAEAEWRKVPPLRSGDAWHKGYEGNRWVITAIMKSLARAEDDIEELVDVYARDLSLPYTYLRIAEIYRKARKRHKALEWAERGIAAFPDQCDSRLREFLADEYHSWRRHEEAMELIWQNFTDQIGLQTYISLKEHAERAKQWPCWRQRAFRHIRRQILHEKKEAGKQPPQWRRIVDHSLLVEIHLCEKDAAAAWQEAKAGGCSDRLWLKLAGARENEHPEDVMPIYQVLAERLIRRKDKKSYAEAARLIEKTRRLMVRTGQSDKFPAYLAWIRAEHKRKRNMMRLLDRFDQPRSGGTLP